MNAPVRADAVDRHDPRVLESGGGLRLVCEASDLTRVQGRRSWKDFDGNAAPDRLLASFVDDSHSTTTKLTDDLEVTQLKVAERAFGFVCAGIIVGIAIRRCVQCCRAADSRGESVKFLHRRKM